MKRVGDVGIVISPIKNGTVIDHITPGEGLTVIRILGIQDGTNVTFTVATNGHRLLAYRAVTIPTFLL